MCVRVHVSAPALWPGCISRNVAASNLSHCHLCSGLNVKQYIKEQQHYSEHLNVSLYGARQDPGLGLSQSGLEQYIVRFVVDNAI